jgi:hypothetical protein
MPSAPGYKRDYKTEQKTASKRGEDKDRAMRNKARRHAEAKGTAKKGDGKDVDHRVPLRSGGSTSDSNTRVRSRSANRSDNGHSKKK